MLQNKISILCTRPLEDALVNEVSVNDIDIEISTFIETVPIRTIEVQQEIENSLLQSTTVVFTSMNAVEAVANELYNHHPDWNIFCIGSTTQSLAKKYFGENSILGTAPDAASLANLIVEEHNTEDVIFFCGNRRRDELPDILRRNNIDVHEIAVYETISVEHKVDKDYNGILFFSPSAVESFFKINKISNSSILFAIGNTTANEIKKYSANKIIISDHPNKYNLVKKVIAHYMKSK
jgi:uroporphyrinogen-III synthase